MAIMAGYLVDLASVTLNETDKTSWIQALPLGKWNHPLYGEIEITPERVAHFSDNVKNNVRTAQLDIDYDHKAYNGEAAGWVSTADARPDGLWVLVEWTETAFKKLKEKAYKYFSPEFADEWTHPATNKTFTDVMFGGGITNRPFLKGILPINLSEAFAEGGATSNGGKEMTPEQLAALAKQLGLPDGASVDEVLAAAAEKLEPDDEDDDEDAGDENEDEGGTETLTEQLPEDLKKLAESNPTIKRLAEIIETQGAQIAKATKSLKETAVSTQVKTFSEKAKEKGYLIPPVTTNKLSEILMTLSEKTATDVAKLFGDVLEVGLVQLGEKGYQRTDGTKTATQLFTEAVASAQGTDKALSYAEAVNQVASKDPELFNNYRSESYAG